MKRVFDFMGSYPERSGIEQSIKPGTRCECRCGETRGMRNIQCSHDAVRMVTVPWGVQWTDNKFANIPMCAPCADWHEKGAKP